MTGIPFQTIYWQQIEKVVHKGDQQNAYWQTYQLERLRIRMVEYEAGYLADHWCSKGHIVHCVEGKLTTCLQNGDTFVLHTGDSYVVSDEQGAHRSFSPEGCRLLIVDGDFLQ